MSCVQSDNVAELEWLSQFVEDPVTPKVVQPSTTACVFFFIILLVVLFLNLFFFK
jgi:hypothetical protein